MKRLVALFGVAAYLAACGDNNVGNRTYDTNTPVDSAGIPVGNTHDDTTATTNNNIYNADSMPTNTTINDPGTGQTSTQKAEQARINAGASLPQNNQQQQKNNKQQ